MGEEIELREEVVQGEPVLPKDPPFVFWEEWVEFNRRDQVHHFHLRIRDGDMKDLPAHELKRLTEAIGVIKEVVSGCSM